jgi:hypothetical protein
VDCVDKEMKDEVNAPNAAPIDCLGSSRLEVYELFDCNKQQSQLHAGHTTVTQGAIYIPNVEVLAISSMLFALNIFPIAIGIIFIYKWFNYNRVYIIQHDDEHSLMLCYGVAPCQHLANTLLPSNITSQNALDQGESKCTYNSDLG